VVCAGENVLHSIAIPAMPIRGSVVSCCLQEIKPNKIIQAKLATIFFFIMTARYYRFVILSKFCSIACRLPVHVIFVFQSFRYFTA
jgi:hypothetical protein